MSFYKGYYRLGTGMNTSENHCRLTQFIRHLQMQLKNSTMQSKKHISTKPWNTAGFLGTSSPEIVWQKEGKVCCRVHISNCFGNPGWCVFQAKEERDTADWYHHKFQKPASALVWEYVTHGIGNLHICEGTINKDLSAVLSPIENITMETLDFWATDVKCQELEIIPHTKL